MREGRSEGGKGEEVEMGERLSVGMSIPCEGGRDVSFGDGVDKQSPRREDSAHKMHEHPTTAFLFRSLFQLPHRRLAIFLRLHLHAHTPTASRRFTTTHQIPPLRAMPLLILRPLHALQLPLLVRQHLLINLPPLQVLPPRLPLRPLPRIQHLARIRAEQRAAAELLEPERADERRARRREERLAAHGRAGRDVGDGDEGVGFGGGAEEQVARVLGVDVGLEEGEGGFEG